MARTYAAVIVDTNLEPKRWKLWRQCSGGTEIIKELRSKGFYANFATLSELEKVCKELSAPSFHKDYKFDESSKGSSSEMNFGDIKPNGMDLHQSMELIKDLKLQSRLATDGRLFINFDGIHVGGDSDRDSDSKPVSFKRSRRLLQEKKHAQEDQGPLCPDEHLSDLDKQTVVFKRGKSACNMDKEGSSEHATSSTEDIDHASLGSRLAALKRRRSTGKTDMENGLEGDLGIMDSTRQRINGAVDVNFNGPPAVCSEGTENGQESFRAEDVKIESDLRSRIKNITAVAFCNDHSKGRKQSYLSGPFPVINKMWNITCVARQALDCIERGGGLENAQDLCSKHLIKEFLENEVLLCGYSVSQFFPSEGKQKEIAERVNYYVHDGDTVVEFCSQAIDYFYLLKDRVANSGKKCDYKKFVVMSSKIERGKFHIDKQALPTGSKLIICISFSFALQEDEINNVINHTLELKPKLIVMIIPLFNQRLQEWLSYNLVWNDFEILQNEVSWPWGKMEVSSTLLERKRGVSPVVYLWSRTDWTTKHRQIAFRFGHLQKPGGVICTALC